MHRSAPSTEYSVGLPSTVACPGALRCAAIDSESRPGVAQLRCHTYLHMIASPGRMRRPRTARAKRRRGACHLIDRRRLGAHGIVGERERRGGLVGRGLQHCGSSAVRSARKPSAGRRMRRCVRKRRRVRIGNQRSGRPHTLPERALHRTAPHASAYVRACVRASERVHVCAGWWVAGRTRRFADENRFDSSTSTASRKITPDATMIDEGVSTAPRPMQCQCTPKPLRPTRHRKGCSRGTHGVLRTSRPVQRRSAGRQCRRAPRRAVPRCAALC
jgi:hypothetical protein